MVSISKKTLKTVTKIGLIVLISYLVYFFVNKGVRLYQAKNQRDSLVSQININKNRVNNLKKQIKSLKEEKKRIKAQYINKEELEKKIKGIFERMSLLDYNLRYIDSKRMCVDRYVIITQLIADSENGKQAGEGILSYLGTIKKSEKNGTIYFVDYVSKKRKNNVNK